MVVTSICLELPERSYSQVLTTTEEKLRHERRERRRLRRKVSQIQYHHIPCSAALDFARTTTPEPLNTKKVHKLALPIMEHYTGESPWEVHRCQSLTPKTHESDITSSGVVGSLSSINGGQLLRRKIARRGLDISRYAQLSSSATHSLPFNVEGSSSPEYLHHVSPHQRRSMTLSLSLNNRPDWTEQDECKNTNTPSIFRKASPLFRKSKSFWTVRQGIHVGKHAGGLTPRDGDLASPGNDSVIGIRRGKIGYPWNCACFV